MAFTNSQTVLVNVTWKFEDSFRRKIKRLARSVLGLEWERVNSKELWIQIYELKDL